MQKVADAFKAGQCGGYGHPNNPQFLLTVDSDSSEVKLSFEREPANPQPGIIFFVLKGSKRLTKAASENDPAFVAKSSYFTSIKVDLTHTFGKGSYVVLCCQYDAEKSYSQVWFSATPKNPSTPIKLSSLTFHGCHLKHTLSFSGNGAAGYGSDKNPQFFLHTTKGSPVTMSLSLSGDAPKDAVCFFVAKSNFPGKRQNDFGNETSRTLTAAYMTGTKTHAGLDCLPAGDYNILVMSKDKRFCDATLAVDLADDSNATLSGETYAKLTFTPKSFDSVLAWGRASVDIVPCGPCNLYKWEDAQRVVDEITRTCQGDECFSDPDFPPTAVSFHGLNKNLQPCEWSRLKEIAVDPRIYYDNADVDDIKQGYIGNCWFCAVIAALGTRAELVGRLIYPASCNPSGIYCVKVFIDAEWKGIVIDDYLPTRDGAQCCARSGTPNEFWFSILEKTYAKIQKGYGNMVSGVKQNMSSPALMEMFTAGNGTTLNHNNEINGKTKFWDTVVEYSKNHWLMSTATADNGSGEKVTDTGLVGHHAYTVIDAKSSADGKIKLLKLRNTWGRQEWKGAWSDAAPEWKQNYEMARLCNVNPNEKKDDGNFWMSVEDFIINLRELNICQITEDTYPHQASINGILTPDDCELKPNILNNVQILMAVSDTSSRQFSFTLDRTDGGNEWGLGLGLFCSKKKTSSRIFCAKEEALSYVAYTGTHGVRAQYEFQQKDLTPDSQVVIVPCFSNGNKHLVNGQIKFRLVVFSKSPFSDFGQATAQPPAVLKGSWKKPTGYASHESPRVILRNKANGPVDATLNVTVNQEDASALFFCVKKGKPRAKWPSKEECVAVSSYLSCPSLTLSLTLPEPGEYTVWVSQQKGKVCPFTLTCIASDKIALEEAEDGKDYGGT